MQSLKIAFITLGCAKNQVDSENLASLLSGFDCNFVSSPPEADVILINTCGFVGDAKEESINVILQSVEETEDACIIVLGCLSELYRDELKKEIPEISGIFGVNQFEGIAEFIKSHFRLKESLSGSPAILKTPSYKRHHAYVKIAEGCSNSCSFCIIPKIRGNFVSRSLQEIVDETRMLVQKGVKEIDLVAQDSTMYGFDLKMKNGLIQLIDELEKIDGLQWIRILYGYPTFYTEELIRRITQSTEVADYFDIPFQHCSDSVLKRMARQESKADIQRALETIHRYSADPFIRTSFIVGFPGETEGEFNELAEFVAENDFSRVGVFQYSHEEFSDAYRFTDDVPDEVKQERQEILLSIVDRKIEEKNRALKGKTISVIVDGYKADEMMVTGRTSQLVPEIDGEVILEEIEAEEGEIIEVTVEGHSGADLIAR